MSGDGLRLSGDERFGKAGAAKVVGGIHSLFAGGLQAENFHGFAVAALDGQTAVGADGAGSCAGYSVNHSRGNHLQVEQRGCVGFTSGA